MKVDYRKHITTCKNKTESFLTKNEEIPKSKTRLKNVRNKN